MCHACLRPSGRAETDSKVNGLRIGEMVRDQVQEDGCTRLLMGLGVGLSFCVTSSFVPGVLLGGKCAEMNAIVGNPWSGPVVNHMPSDDYLLVVITLYVCI